MPQENLKEKAASAFGLCQLKYTKTETAGTESIGCYSKPGIRDKLVTGQHLFKYEHLLYEQKARYFYVLSSLFNEHFVIFL